MKGFVKNDMNIFQIFVNLKKKRKKKHSPNWQQVTLRWMVMVLTLHKESCVFRYSCLWFWSTIVVSSMNASHLCSKNVMTWSHC